jgi:hypothetical protein
MTAAICLSLIVGVGIGFALALLLGWHIDTRRRRQDAADPLAEYETVAAPEHAPSRN